MINKGIIAQPVKIHAPVSTWPGGMIMSGVDLGNSDISDFYLLPDLSRYMAIFHHKLGDIGHVRFAC